MSSPETETSHAAAVVIDGPSAHAAAYFARHTSDVLRLITFLGSVTCVRPNVSNDDALTPKNILEAESQRGRGRD